MTTCVPPASAYDSSPWLRPLTQRAGRMRMFCIPPAGSGPNFYRTWAAGLPRDIEALVVHLPGREGRFREPCLTHYHTAVEMLYRGIRPALTAGNYALVGHSMGALLAYGVALTAARLGDPAPKQLVLSGIGGPGSAVLKPNRERWSEAELVADLRAMGGTAEEVLANRELLQLLLPVLRADYALCESFRTTPPVGPQLSCPLTVLGGEDDDIPPADLARWADVSTGQYTQHIFPGGHFFLTGQSADPALAAICAGLNWSPLNPDPPA